MANSRPSSTRRYKYYEILETSKLATQEEIKRAFRRLARRYHPDHNPDNSEAEAKFKRINEAYQVLSNPAERAAYDSSPAECPVCWTHEVIETAISNWRCRHCACEFDVYGSPLSEIIERAAIPGRHRVRLTAFQSMQCSWCRRFFTQPFRCPDRKLHSSCLHFDRLSEEERDRFVNDEKWWWRMVDLIRWTENNGVLKKCVQCGAFNPNPRKSTCWNCGHSIYDRCPNCGLPTLHFDLDSNLWRCANARCGRKKFVFEKRGARYKQYGQPDEYTPQGVSTSECPSCGQHLRFDSAMVFWRCTNRKCRGIYTYDELRKMEGRKRPRQERPSAPTQPRKTTAGRSPSLQHNFRGFSSRIRQTWNHIPVSIRKLFLCLLVITGLVLLTRTGYFLFTGEVATIRDVIVFLLGLGVWIWIISILRNYRYKRSKPSFKLVLFAALGIALVLAFAGIQPLATYKDAVVESVVSLTQSIRSSERVVPPTVSPPGVSYTETEIEELVIVLVNEERRKFGLSTLSQDTLLTSLAREHSTSMVENRFFSHDRYPGQRGFDYNQPPGTIRGENLSKTPTRRLIPGPYLSLQEVCEWAVSGWMKSPGHRDNILESRFAKTGVGVSLSGGYLYITQMFEGAH